MGRGGQRGLNFNNHIGHIHNRVWPLFFEILCTIYLIESIKKSVWAGLRNDVLKIWAAEPVKPEAAGSSPVNPASQISKKKPLSSKLKAAFVVLEPQAAFHSTSSQISSV
jgi:hypothetical protein